MELHLGDFIARYTMNEGGVHSFFRFCAAILGYFCWQSHASYIVKTKQTLPSQPCGACKQARRPKKGKTEATVAAPSAPSHLSFGKDTGLALFHALGKILYNKRLDPGIDEVDNLASSLTLGQGLLPAGSQAGLMPSSSKECEVADRYGGVVFKPPCWRDKSS